MRRTIAMRMQVWLAGVILSIAVVQPAIACISDGPPVDRRHYIAMAAKNPWTEVVTMRTLYARDLISLALPSGTVDDWQVEVTESRNGVIRLLTEDEFSAVLGSRRALTIALILPGADRAAVIPTPSVRVGALRPGDATLRITQRKGTANFTMNFKVEAVDAPQRPPVPARSSGSGPAVAC